MGDDKSKRGGADRSRISLEQDYEVRDWTKSLGVTKAELSAAVKAVGNSAEKVREYLKKKKMTCGFPGGQLSSAQVFCTGAW